MGLRGPKPGSQRVGGRQSGTPNKNTVAMGGENLVALARKHTDKALNKLIELCDCDIPAVAKGAADSLLDRGWGRPGQSLMIQGDETKPIKHEHVISFKG